MSKNGFLHVGDRVSIKKLGRWNVESFEDGYINLSRKCRDGSIERWKMLETRLW